MHLPVHIIRQNVYAVCISFLVLKGIQAWLQQARLALMQSLVYSAISYSWKSPVQQQSMHKEGHPSYVEGITILMSYSLYTAGVQHTRTHILYFLEKRTCKRCQNVRPHCCFISEETPLSCCTITSLLWSALHDRDKENIWGSHISVQLDSLEGRRGRAGGWKRSWAYSWRGQLVPSQYTLFGGLQSVTDTLNQTYTGDLSVWHTDGPQTSFHARWSHWKQRRKVKS